MEDAADLAVHRRRRAHHVATECLADRLVAETNTEDRNFSRGCGDKVEADAGLVRCAGSRGEHDRFGLAGQRIGHADLVVAPDLAPRANVAQEMEQVEGE